MTESKPTKSNIVDKNSKWGEFFLGEELVSLYIPRDPLNPVKRQWVSINGNGIWLTVGEQLTVPKSVAKVWQNSFDANLKAEAMMRQVVEIA